MVHSTLGTPRLLAHSIATRTQRAPMTTNYTLPNPARSSNIQALSPLDPMTRSDPPPVSSRVAVHPSRRGSQTVRYGEGCGSLAFEIFDYRCAVSQRNKLEPSVLPTMMLSKLILVRGHLPTVVFVKEWLWSVAPEISSKTRHHLTDVSAQPSKTAEWAP